MKSLVQFACGFLLVGLLSSTTSFSSTSHAVSVNPTPDCSAGSTCTVTFTFTGDLYEWNVPVGITSLTVDVIGASGGKGTSPSNSNGGRGARMQGVLAVTPSQTLKILVAGKGVDATNNGGGGGGGGSFIVTASNSALVVAGGGGGGQGNCCSVYEVGSDASTSTSGTQGSSNSGLTQGSAGTNGNGGGAASSLSSGAGGGLLTDGSDGAASGSRGRSFLNGGSGGSATEWGSWTGSGAGGFGGGGGAYGGAGGGGGGYSGGGGAGGSSNWSAGGGGGSYSVATTQTNTAAYQTGDGLIRVTYLNAPSVTSFTSSQASPTNTTSTIAYSFSFSQNVNTVAASDFSNAGTATGCSFSPSASSGTNFTLTVSGCSEGTLRPQVLANQVFGTVTNSNGPSANSPASTTITIDRTAPTVSSVTAPSNGTYSPTGFPTGSALTFSLVMSESVTVTTSGGTPSLTLTIGSVTRNASYLSQSDSRTLTFQYTLTSSLDEIDSDGIALSSTLSLNGGVIADLATNALTNTSLTAAQSLPSLTSVLVAQRASAPTITGIDAGNTQLSVNFTAGSNNGAAISNYKYSLNGGAFTAFSPVDTTSPLVITGLTNGTSYAVRILAITAVGDGDSSTAVSATPTAIVVAGGSNITATYGQSATSLAFTASGGTSPYTFSLSPSVSGISIDASTGVVTTSASLSAGSYSTFVIATDNASRSGQKAITVTISADTPTITIALTGSVTSTPLAASVAIIATVSEEGSVDFQLGGVSISGCSAVATSSGSASCSWTPGSLGSATLTAILTPTDNTNYITATSPSLAITVVTGTSAITLTLSTSTPTKGQTITITATTTDIAGTVAFRLNGKLITGCKSKTVSSGIATCTWRSSRHGEQILSARFTPTNNAYNGSSTQVKVMGLRRSGRG